MILKLNTLKNKNKNREMIIIRMSKLIKKIEVIKNYSILFIRSYLWIFKNIIIFVHLTEHKILLFKLGFTIPIKSSYLNSLIFLNGSEKSLFSTILASHILSKFS